MRGSSAGSCSNSWYPIAEPGYSIMRDLAEAIDGFLEWRDAYDGLTYWGFVVFASHEAAMAWKGNPIHGAIHQQGEASVYSSFGTQVFELVREASWQRDEVPEPHG